MKAIGFYNKHNNDFYGYVTNNQYVITKGIKKISTFHEKDDWVKGFGENTLSTLFRLKSDGRDQDDYINEMFKYSNKEDIEIRVIDYNQIIRKKKLTKIKNR